MMQTSKVLAMVLAGGEGTRLYPLTAERSKPAVPFGSRYRVVDFALSNLINSGIDSIYVLVQYRSQSLIEHIRKAWTIASVVPSHFITVVPPQIGESQDWYLGTSDAVFQNRNLIDLHRPDVVAIFGADHVYRMDIRQMIRFHLAQEAEVTVAALPVPLEKASSFGVIQAQANGRIVGFQEKPEHPQPMPGRPTHAFASMGNYIFSTRSLMRNLREAQRRREKDFGRHMLPRMLESGACMLAYDFSRNETPGTKPYEEPAYWRDVGTIESYFQASLDLLGAEPQFDVFNPQWPIHSSGYQGPPLKILHGSIDNAAFGAGTIVNGANISHSIIRREVLLDDDVELEECIIQDYVHISRGCRLRRVIVDSHNQLAPGTTIGYDIEADKSRFHVDSHSGVVVVPQGRKVMDPDSYFEGET